MNTETDFARWELSTRLALAERGISYRIADPLIEEARAQCAESGLDPDLTCGSPAEFTAAVLADLPEGSLDDLDRHGMSVNDYLTGSLFAVGWLTIVWSIFGAVLAGSFTVDLTQARLVGSALLGVTLISAYGVPGALWASGRRRLANWSYALTVVLIVLTATAFVELPRTVFARVPMPALIVVGAALIWLSLRLSEDRFASADELGATGTPVELEPEQWFTRLHGLLITRHEVPTRRAAELVAEARSHLGETGTASPAAEFGPVSRYAAALAEPETDHRPPWWRTRPAQTTLAAVCVVFAAGNTYSWLSQGHLWLALLIGLPATVGFGLELRKQLKTFGTPGTD
jgi:hypothetical protein